MHISSNVSDLRKAVRVASLAARSGIPLPVLTGAYIQSTGETTRITCTDLELTITTPVPVQVEEAGEAVLPAKLLLEILENLPEGDIRIAASGRNVEITSGRSRFELVGFPPEDFPIIPEEYEGPAFVIPAATLRTLILQTVFACSTDNLRPALTGVLLDVSGSRITAVATDGSRLALSQAELSGPVATPVQAVVPGRAAHALTRIVGNDTGDVTVAVSGDGKIAFHLSAVRLVSRCIAERFPDYRRVLPAEYRQKIRTLTSEILDALKRVRITTQKEGRVVTIGASGDTVTLTSAAGEIGRGREEITASVEGEPTTISFNPAYLIEALQVVPTEGVELGITGPVSPAVIRPVGRDDFLCLVAPVRVYEPVGA